MITLKNINEIIVNQRLKELIEAKDNILETITHDLKTPINVMLSLLEISLFDQGAS
jgi:signal transduction histidine kinase